jgi:hypothetical protein
MKQRSVFDRLRPPVGALLLATLLASGCGPRFGSIAGIVTYQGKPLRWGSVKVSWTGAPGVPNAGSAALNQDGSYEVGQVPAGATVKIFLDVPPVPPRFGGANPDPKSLQEKFGYVKLPDKYTHVDTSGFSLEVKEGINVFNIDMPAEKGVEPNTKPSPAPKKAAEPSTKASSTPKGPENAKPATGKSTRK